MLPNPTNFRPRGRSRQVSHAALARQASEERRVITTTYPSSERSQHDKSSLVSDTLLSPSPSPPDSVLMSPIYYDSPPSPPRSLEDQVHVAYALDDIHLAKVLLLRLKGINITSDDDPRIAAVRDEDFDFCFVPHGRLEYDQDDKFNVERERKEKELVEQRNRADRLRACERIWVHEKRRLRRAMQAALRKREADARRREEDENRIRIEKERADAAEAERRARLLKRKTQLPCPRNLVSYKIAPSSTNQDPEPFVYDFMIAPLNTRHTRPLSQSSLTSQSSKSSSPFSRPLFDDSRTVSFGQVLTSMQGPLFPPEPGPTSPTSPGRSSRQRRETELLDCLLKVIELEVDEHRRRKGKDHERPPVRRRDSARSTVSSLCAACSSSASFSTSPSRLSWLSFSSASSIATTMSSSTESVSRVRKRSTTWFGSSTSASTSSLSPSPPRTTTTHSCGHLTPVPPAESPLLLLTLNKPTSTATSHPSIRSTLRYAGASSLTDTTTPANLMLQRVSRFLELAKTFQSAYMNTTLSFSISSPETLEHTTSDRSQRTPRKANRKRLGPPGQRVLPGDVAVFLRAASSARCGNDNALPLPPPIPLRSRSVATDAAPRTKLPDPLPYPLRFKPVPVPCRSPFRLHAAAARKWGARGGEEDERGSAYDCALDGEDDDHLSPHPSQLVGATARGGMILRVRAVENPVYLRIKAVCNVVRKDGIVEVGQGFKEGTLGAGKERVLQIAFESIGRSWLGCEGVWGRGYEHQQQWQRGRWKATSTERERGRRGRGRQWWC